MALRPMFGRERSIAGIVRDPYSGGEAMATAARYTDDSKQWPYGRLTTLCTRCNGSGSDKAKIEAYLLSRTPHTGTPPNVNCPDCDGRGRLLTDERIVKGRR